MGLAFLGGLPTELLSGPIHLATMGLDKFVTLREPNQGKYGQHTVSIFGAIDMSLPNAVRLWWGTKELSVVETLTHHLAEGKSISGPEQLKETLNYQTVIKQDEQAPYLRTFYPKLTATEDPAKFLPSGASAELYDRAVPFCIEGTGSVDFNTHLDFLADFTAKRFKTGEDMESLADILRAFVLANLPNLKNLGLRSLDEMLSRLVWLGLIGYAPFPTFPADAEEGALELGRSGLWPLTSGRHELLMGWFDNKIGVKIERPLVGFAQAFPETIDELVNEVRLVNAYKVITVEAPGVPHPFDKVVGDELKDGDLGHSKLPNGNDWRDSAFWFFAPMTFETEINCEQLPQRLGLCLMSYGPVPATETRPAGKYYGEYFFNISLENSTGSSVSASYTHERLQGFKDEFATYINPTTGTEEEIEDFNFNPYSQAAQTTASAIAAAMTEFFSREPVPVGTVTVKEGETTLGTASILGLPDLVQLDVVFSVASNCAGAE